MMLRVKLKTVLACAALASMVSMGSIQAQPDVRTGWLLYSNSKFGFSLSYPADIFIEQPTPNPDAGRLFLSKDGRARLIASAGSNSSEDTVEGYQRYVMTEVYQGARFDYTPLRKTWFVVSGTREFVVSGTREAEMFYERVTFACDGKLIYGWQLTYPAEERRLYDRIVEQIHRNYRAGRGEDGTCPPT